MLFYYKSILVIIGLVLIYSNHFLAYSLDLEKPLHPKFPAISGSYQMTKNWSIELPFNVNRRFEEDGLVLWRPGFTIWVTVWGNPKLLSVEEQMYAIKKTISKNAYSFTEKFDKDESLFSYRLKESSDDKRVGAYYCFVFSEKGYVQMAFYFDHENDLNYAKN